MNLLLFILALFLLSAYGDFGNVQCGIWGGVCLMLCIVSATWHPDESIEDPNDMQDWEATTDVQGLGDSNL